MGYARDANGNLHYSPFQPNGTSFFDTARSSGLASMFDFNASFHEPVSGRTQKNYITGQPDFTQEAKRMLRERGIKAVYPAPGQSLDNAFEGAMMMNYKPTKTRVERFAKGTANVKQRPMTRLGMLKPKPP